MKRARPWLLPLVPLYRAGLALAKMRSVQPRRLAWPAISIGNLSTGGAGKTPLTIALALALTARGLHVDVLSRGYGRSSKAPSRVDPNGTADEFGDEPLVIAREAGVGVFVAAERYEAGLLAESDESVVLKAPDFSRTGTPTLSKEASAPEKSFPAPSALHLLDDGFQHRRLARNLDILLLNRKDWTDTLLPAGNLREPLTAVRRAHIIAVPADDPELESQLRAWGWLGTVWRLHRRMAVPQIDGPIAAFCGIARPEQFFQGLETAGLRVASRTAFPDHHRYVQHDLDCLVDAARLVRATALITTEKDLARLGRLAASFPENAPLRIAQLRTEIDNEEEVISSLISLIDRLKSASTSRHPL